jgi:thiol-disulfide isomerase/thioredoxin
VSKRKKRQSAAPPASYLVAALLAAIAGFATIYLSFAPSDNGVAPSEGTAPGGRGPGATSNSPLVGLNKGAMAAFLVRPQPQEIAEFTFEADGGAAKSLKDWRGKVVLLNLWATWCVPCREEMPALDKLQAALGGANFEVVAINIDRGGPDKARDFLKEIGVNKLALYTDPSGKLFSTIRAVGMPTTLLIDREGREIGRLVGPADWASPEAKTLIEAAIGAPVSGRASQAQ